MYQEQSTTVNVASVWRDRVTIATTHNPRQARDVCLARRQLVPVSSVMVVADFSQEPAELLPGEESVIPRGDRAECSDLTGKPWPKGKEEEKKEEKTGN